MPPPTARPRILDATEIEVFITSGLEQFTGRTLVSPDDLAADLAETRGRGYAMNVGESRDSTASVAAPILTAIARSPLSAFRPHGPDARRVEVPVRPTRQGRRDPDPARPRISSGHQRSLNPHTPVVRLTGMTNCFERWCAVEHIEPCEQPHHSVLARLSIIDTIGLGSAGCQDL